VVPEPESADVVLFVSDAGCAYSPVELDALARMRARGAQVVGVLTKIDAYPQWAEVQRANRSQLQAANLDSPPIPLLPVSSALCESGRQRGDDSLSVASGVPQLLEFLRDRIGTKLDPALHDWVLGEVRSITDALSTIWNRELNALQAAGDSPQQRQQRAVAELDRRQQLSAQWQLALSDGVAELMAQVDFDLRDRLREVMELAEEDITTANPMRHWAQFDKSVRAKVQGSVQASFELAEKRAQVLSAQVAVKLAGNADGSYTGVALPQGRVARADEALSRIKPMQPPNRGAGFVRAVNSLRGSYGGILMVGVLTSLAGLALISVWSVAAGVLLGLFTSCVTISLRSTISACAPLRKRYAPPPFPMAVNATRGCPSCTITSLSYASFGSMPRCRVATGLLHRALVNQLTSYWVSERRTLRHGDISGCC
jgi:hypothetical protein